MNALSLALVLAAAPGAAAPADAGPATVTAPVPVSRTAAPAAGATARISASERAFMRTGSYATSGERARPLRHGQARNGFSRRMVWPRSAPTETPITFTPTSSSTRLT